MKNKPIDPLQHSKLTGTIHSGITATTLDGKPARLAIIDDNGNILDAGLPVAKEVWHLVIGLHLNMLRATGHIVMHSTPPGIALPAKEAAAPEPADKPQAPAGRGKK
jgi:hypothetical protein